jgi:transcriptional regulator with XRE-family HTH domain
MIVPLVLPRRPSRVVRVFRERLLTLRLKLALSQEELADKAGIGRSTIIKLERGGHCPRPSTVRKLARALGVRPSELVDIG